MQVSDFIRTKFRISAKVALYSSDHYKVVIMKYPKAYGLPGGHIEKNEEPEAALRRELLEELGITIDKVTRRDFFLRRPRSRSMILAFVAIIPESMEFHPPRPDREMGIWMTKPEVASLDTISVAYKRFILDNWPS